MKEELPSPEELLESLKATRKKAAGQDIYVIEAIGILVQSNTRTEKAIDKFEKSTSRSEIVMMRLCVAQLLLAITQIVLATAALYITKWGPKDTWIYTTALIISAIIGIYLFIVIRKTITFRWLP
jgi:hypothetical protein